ncbi:MAG: rhombosortase [Burkholderiaceae bacterium]
MPSSTEASAVRAWAALAAALALASVLAFFFVPAPVIDWQPGLARTEPWRAWSAALLHYSPLHLAANLAGAALVAAFGWTARVRMRSVAAWLAAWPLTQVGLLLRPELLHYGGLSGVLHAGAAGVAVSLLVNERGRRRAIGAAVLVGLALKVASEAPWSTLLRQPAGWDIAIAPLAHASGLVMGLLAAGVAELVSRGLARLRIPPPEGTLL